MRLSRDVNQLHFLSHERNVRLHILAFLAEAERREAETRTGWYDELRALKSRGSQAARPGSLAGLHRAREETLSQFFTPTPIVRFMWGLLEPSLPAPDKHDAARVSFFDPMFGSGRLFQFCNPDRHMLAGSEIDRELYEKVVKAVAAAGFTFSLQCGSIETMRTKRYNVALLNPAFSIQIDSPFCEPFECGAYGRYGPRSSHKTHTYALAQGLDSSSVVMAIVTRAFAESLKAEHPYFYPRLRTTFFLPRDAFMEEGVRYDTALLVFDKDDVEEDDKRVFHLKDLTLHEDYVAPLDVGYSRYWASRDVELGRAMIETGRAAITLPVTGDKRIRVCHSGRKLVLKFACGLAQARVMNRVLGAYLPTRQRGEGRYPKGVTYTGEGVFDLENFVAQTNPSGAFEKFMAEIRSWGYETVIDPAVPTYIKKRARKTKVLTTPLKHTVWMPDGGLKHYLLGRKKIRAVVKEEFYPMRVKSDGRRITEVAVGQEIKLVAESPGVSYLFRHQGWQCRMTFEQMRARCDFPHFKPEMANWAVVHKGLAVAYPHLYKQMERTADSLGLKYWLTWPFQFEDMCEVKVRGGNTVVGWEMGTGKARLALSLCVMGGKHNLIVLESRLLGEMIDEIRTLCVGPSMWQVIESPADCENLRKINILTYSRLRSAIQLPSGKKKYPYADRLRRRIHSLVVDECHNLKNYDTDQSISAMRLCAKQRYPMTGTPVDNYPRDILPMIQFAAGDGTAAQVFGHHRPYMKVTNLDDMSYSERAVDIFKDRFVTLTWVTNEFDDDLRSGAKREIPKIKDVAAFRQLVAPFVKRRLTMEPEVAPFVRIPKPEIRLKTVDWQMNHLRYYVKASDDFSAWFRKMRDEHKKLSLVEILAKIQAVVNACNYPQGGVAGMPPYTDETSKQEYALERIKTLVKFGRKLIFFARSPQLINLFAVKLKEAGIDHVVFHGLIPIKKRVREMDERFRRGPAPVLLATKGVLQTGYNIWQANYGLFYDRSWSPKEELQSLARMLRPQQRQEVIGEFLHLEGSVDQYQSQACDFKSEAMKAGLDYGEDLLDPDEFQHIETILGRFVEDYERRVGIQLREKSRRQLARLEEVAV